MKPTNIKWLFKKKPKCIDCYFLAILKNDGMGGIEPLGSVNSPQRKQIKKGRIDTWLNPRLHLACMQGVWEDSIKEKEEDRLEKITKDRPDCYEMNRFKKFNPEGPAVGKALEEHQKEVEKKESVPMFRTPGYGWKAVLALIGLLGLIGTMLTIPSFRNWFLSFF